MQTSYPITNCNHTERKHKAHGLCASCYNQYRNNATPEIREKYLKSLKNGYKPQDPKLKRDSHLFRRYSLSVEEFNHQVVAQGNKCPLCHKLFTYTPYVDHDHITGKRRGIICSGCNSKLGTLEKDKTILKSLFSYLLEYNSRSISIIKEIINELNI